MALNGIQNRLGQINYTSLLVTVLLTVLTLAFAVFLGLVSSTGNLFFVVIIGGIMAAVIVAFFPVPLLWLAIIGGLVITGLFRLYLPQFQFVRWLVAGASYLMLIHVAAELFRGSDLRSRSRHTPGLIHLAILFLVVAGITTLYNRGGLGAFAAGAKNYFQVWPLMFVLALVRWEEKTIRTLPKVMLWIALFQLPFVVQQYLFIVPTRVGLGYGIVPVDVVAGTFGADRMGGGANSTLSMFLIFVWAGLLAQWKYKLVSGRMLAFLSLLLLAPLFFNESKVAILYLGLVFFLLFREEVISRPQLFFGGLIVFVVLTAGLLYSYTALNTQHRQVDISTEIQSAIDENFGDKRSSRWSRELNRLTVYTFWAKEHGLDDLGHTLIGHGLGASKDSEGLIVTHSLASTRYAGMGIGNTSVSSLLWDVGVLGLSVVVAMFWWVYRAAGQLSRQYMAHPQTQALFRGVQAVIPILFLSLAHKNFFVFNLPYQTFVFGLLGFVAYWVRRTAEQQTVRSIGSEPR
jgi:hypothetical protein